MVKKENVFSGIINGYAETAFGSAVQEIVQDLRKRFMDELEKQLQRYPEDKMQAVIFPDGKVLYYCDGDAVIEVPPIQVKQTTDGSFSVEWTINVIKERC